MQLTAKDLRDILFSRLPLVKFIFSQDDVALVQRPIDMTWYYRHITPIAVSGFNPLGRQIFYGRNSYLAKFISGHAEPIFEGEIDWYLYEIFFAVHDFIHIWAIAALLPYFPKCSEPTVFEDSISANDLAYILLMSEVSAVVAMDYWMLSEMNLSDELGCDVSFRCLTTPFKQEDVHDARRISPGFEVKRRSFFEWLARGYFDDTFVGFEKIDANVLRNLAPFLVKEMRVGQSQRSLIKAWVSYLKLLAGAAEGDVALSLGSRQRIEAMEALSGELWNIFGEAKGSFALPLKSSKKVFLPTSSFPVDFRFIDLTKIEIDHAAVNHSELSTKQFGYFAAQYVSLFECSDGYDFDADHFDEIVRRKNLTALFSVFGDVKPRFFSQNEHVHLFIPN